MTDDLVKRLRLLDVNHIDAKTVALDAADRIEALTAERDALRDQVKAFEGQLVAAENMTDIRALEICLARMKWDKETQRILRTQLHHRRTAVKAEGNP